MRFITRAVRWLGRLVVRLVKTGILLAVLAGVPAGLITQTPSALPHRVPTFGQLGTLLTSPVTDTTVITLLAVALWVVWAAFVVSFAVEVVATVRGVPRPRLGPIAPMQSLAGWLISGIVTGVLVAGPVLTVAGHAAPASASTSSATTTSAPSLGTRGPGGGSATSAAAAVHTVPAVTSAAHVTLAGDTAPATHQTPAQQPAVYRVRHGDWLGYIAQRYLGNFDRYPEIQDLNPNLIPATTGIHGPDHIEAGWRLILPADAHDDGPHTHATGDLIAGPAPTTPPHTDPPTTAAPPTTGGTGGQSTATTPPPTTTPPAASPAPTMTTPAPTADATTPGSAGRSETPQHSPAAEPTDTAPQHARTGVTLPTGWVTIPLAAALLAAVTLVWLRRRHRYIPRPLREGDTDTDDLLPPPPVVPRLRRTVRDQAPELLHRAPAEQPTVADYAHTDQADRAPLPPVGPDGPHLAGFTDPLAAAGVGLTGPGADAAARGLLVATLSAGSPTDPDARGHVVIPADALTTLLGAHAVQVDTMPRLHIAATTSDALTMIEELLIERRRQLQDYDAADIDQMRTADPYHPPMPPILLIAENPSPELHVRVATTFQLGAPLAINAVLLGDWPGATTRVVGVDGRTSDTQERLTVLDVPTTVQLLNVLHEAHTGKPTSSTDAPTTEHHPGDGSAASTFASKPAPDEPAVAPSIEDVDGTDPATSSSGGPTTDIDTAEHAPDEPQPQPPVPVATAHRVESTRRLHLPVRVRVLGEPTIYDQDGNAITALRQHARELLVYLAVHRTGADLSDIMEVIWPTATVRRAGERLSTEAADVRRRIREAAGETPETAKTSKEKRLQPIVNSGSRYHLDPAVVDIDLWRLDAAMRDAAAAKDPARRQAALRRAVDLHTATLADGCDFDWLQTPREHARRQGLRARVHLAGLLAADLPDQAAELLQEAADIDPLDENIAQRAMRAHAAVGNTTAVRTRFEQLSAALDAIDEEPSAETVQLLRQLEHTNAQSAATRPGTAAAASSTDMPG